ncbi:hypothetical protein A1A1_09071 [Planococcus antarcticus DSM 14505]|uniref:Uncharacterized protein n=1 Tax=Planococcus antarcticus DSM 14505 TaxID=1185653 RepID=A0AA87ILL1_9BACL|nr:hypothetical protein [Planococcus antarcticus]EIM06694.1 hypothetical protein A1A1_09071 [Planococcus antarcticus DSM 14505]
MNGLKGSLSEVQLVDERIVGKKPENISFAFDQHHDLRSAF